MSDAAANPGTFHLTIDAALKLGPPPAGALSIPVFAHRTLKALLYQPGNPDPQSPHTRDEVYVVARGTGKFSDGGSNTTSLAPGDFIFVAAGQTHRFEDVSADFAVWVFFYGEKISP